MPELEVNAENWRDLHALGFRHFLNVVPEKLSETEFLDLVAFAKRAAGCEEHFAFGICFDEVRGPVADRPGTLGLYVRRPGDWSPI